MKIKLLFSSLFFVCCFANAQYTKLLDFAGATNGKYPKGDLISDGTFLYGMTSIGGTNNLGTIFKIKPNGTGYVKLLDFAGATNGSSPFGSLFSDGTFLYGMTNLGGINGIGCIFKIKPDGTGYLKLLDFNNTNGSSPDASFISDGTFLYGTTKSGGTNGLGTVFKIKPDGTGFATLLNFSGAVNGSNPRGTLYSDGTFLYGMTEQGGTSSIGVIFKIKPDGTGYVKLLNFTGLANGRYPAGSFISDGTFLYGMANQGGANNLGCIFKIKPDGTGFAKMHDFAIAPDGNLPYGSLKSDGTFFYGMTYSGGTGSKGTIFKIKPAGTGYAVLLSFSGVANGSNPYGSFYFSAGYLYGMNYSGGANNSGTVFKFYTLLIDNVNASMVNCFGGNNGTAAATVSGGISPYVYLWNTTPAQTTQTATGLTAGNYTVTVTDANISTTTATVAITQPTVLVANAGAGKTICSGSSTTIGGAASGGTSPYTYVWSPAASLNSSTAVNPTASPTVTTTYTETVTDSKGCTASKTVTVTVNNLSSNPTSASASTGTICKGSSVTVTVNGGSLGTGASWKWYSATCGTTLAGTGSSITVAPTTTKTYYVRAEGTCNTTTCASVTVTVSSPSVTVSKTNVSCSGGSNGSATATPSGGITPYSYLWSNLGTASQISNLTSQIYTVTITDAIGCTTSSTVSISQPAALSASMSVTDASSCSSSDGSASATVSGGTSPYTYSWSPSGQTSQTATGLPADTFIVSVSDFAGCLLSDTAIVSCITGITSSAMQDFIQVYPNPTNGKFNVQWLMANGNTSTINPVGNNSNGVNHQPLTIEVYNVYGEKVYSSQLPNTTTNNYPLPARPAGGSTNIDLSEANNGIYFLQIKTEPRRGRDLQGSVVKKIIIQK
ncbi:MAG: hypothetical protein HY841_15780 [Bacteroidetes bacterium]|nr:hypothetical protein [Bacteroidota bacterium]